tara:strand:+ start:1358 stop:1570 length:213 start_codon:yes stop_codon:yes gene_type:complete
MISGFVRRITPTAASAKPFQNVKRDMVRFEGGKFEMQVCLSESLVWLIGTSAVSASVAHMWLDHEIKIAP